MFLSAIVSRLEPDGHLIVDLADDDGPRLRFGPLSAGMAWECWEQDRWVATDQDCGVALISRAHESRRDLPVLRYLADLPAPMTESLHRIRYLQTTVLQLCARSSAARDLLEGNLPLLWLVAERYSSEPACRHEAVAALNWPQRKLLEWVLQRDVRPAQVRFLRKVVLDTEDRQSLVHLRRLAADEATVMRLRHWRQIPADLLRLLAEAPYLAQLHALKQEVDGAADVYEIRRIIRQWHRLLQDTVRLAALLRPDGGAEALITRCRSWSRIRGLHDVLIDTIQTLGWESVLDSDINPNTLFGPPPIPSGRDFIAVKSVAELITEGTSMHHCVLSKALEVMRGRSAIYQVTVAGERGTLEVSMGASGEPIEIEDFRLACNAEPSIAAWEAAYRWLEEGRQDFGRRKVSGREVNRNETIRGVCHG